MNGILRGEYKARNGKLVRCSIQVSQNMIKWIKFTGDFFIYPEEKIEELERRMIGAKKEEISKRIREFFGGVKAVGAGADDFIEVIMRAIET
jgi:hypothetical protein